jgi:hypothetical protein
VRSVARPGIEGALVLVGGHSRGVGKTLTIERVLWARRGEPWVAVKVSAHRHGSAGCALSVDEDTTANGETQTGRYLLAGAARAFLLRAPDAQLAAAARFVNTLRSEGANTVVESNRLVDWVVPDRVLFAVAPLIDDWKPSSARILTRADALVVCTAGGPAAAAAVPAADARSRAVFRLTVRGDNLRFAEWLDDALGSPSVRSRSDAAATGVPHVAIA